MSVPSSEDLWPSLDESLGRQPCFPSGPVWSVLPTLKGQMADMLTDMGAMEREGVSIDSSNGIVHIDGSAIIEPGVHIIGPSYVGPNAIIRHGAYIREFSWICADALVGMQAKLSTVFCYLEPKRHISIMLGTPYLGRM